MNLSILQREPSAEIFSIGQDKLGRRINARVHLDW